MENINLKDILDIKNEIRMIIKIDNNDVNKEVYFLDNSNYKDKEKKKHFHDYLKELNELNTELYIDGIKYKYTKCFKFSEGEHNIKLKIKILLKDCSGMFYNCEKLTNIDFSSFNTSNVNNMS